MLSLPKGVVDRIRKKAREAGVTPEEYLVELVSQGLDPEEKAREYVETAEELVKVAAEELERGNLRQASEKIWGAAALAVKAHAYAKEGRRLASRKELWDYEKELARKLGKWVDDAWYRANGMHVNFYEGWASKEHVEDSLKHVQKLVRAIAKELGS